MNEDTVLIVAGVGVGIYLLNKSGFFEATKGAAAGVGSAASGIGQGAGQTGQEIGETVAAIVNPFQALSEQLTNALNSLGNAQKPSAGYYKGSPAGTTQISPMQLNTVLKNSGVSTMPQVLADVRNDNGTLYSPLFVGGSYTPSNPASTVTKATSTPTKSSSSSKTPSKLILTPRVGGGYKVTGASNIKLNR